MKIWVVGRGYPTPANKMWGSFELEQAKLLARCGHSVSYIALTLSFFNRKDPRGVRQFEVDGVKVHVYSHLYFPGKLGVYWESYEDNCWIRLFNEASRISGQPDIIHIHYPSMQSGINVIESYRTKGVKIFVTEHWSRVLLKTLNKNELMRIEYYSTHANCFACVSEVLQSAVRALTHVSVPMEIIPNIVAPVFFNELFNKPSDIVTFVVVGRLVALKQIDVIIKVFLRCFKRNSNVRLKIIGSGSDKVKLESICKNDQRISFLGEISLEKVAHEIATSNVLVSFSKYETFAAPVAEAWACGKPVIVSDKSGIAQYVNNETGVVVSANSPKELGVALRHLCKEHANYSASRIREYARNNFSDEAIIAKLNHMYCEC